MVLSTAPLATTTTRCYCCPATKTLTRGPRGATKFNYLFQDRQSSSSVAGIVPRATFSLPALWRPRKATTRICLTTRICPSSSVRFTSTAANVSDNDTSESLNHEDVTAEPKRPAMRVTDSSFSKFESFRQHIERLTQYRFRDPDYLKAALYKNNTIADERLVQTRSHLAIIGDVMFKATYFVDHFPCTAEFGRLNRQFSDEFCTNVHFSKIARRNGLDRIAQSTVDSHAGSPVRAEATLVEAIIGAVYYDSGESAAVTRKVIYAMQLGQSTAFSKTRSRSVLKPATSYTSSSTTAASTTGASEETVSGASDTKSSSPTISDLRESLSNAPSRAVTFGKHHATWSVSEVLALLQEVDKPRLHSQRRRLRTRILKEYVPGGEKLYFLGIVKKLRAQLKTPQGIAALRDQLPVIKAVLQSRPLTLSNSGDQDVKEVLDLIEKIDKADVTQAQENGTADGKPGAKETEATSCSSSIPEVNSDTDLKALATSQEGVDEQSRSELTPPAKSLGTLPAYFTKDPAQANRLERRRILLRYAPDATLATPLAELLSSITHRLQSSPDDPELRDGRREIEAVVHVQRSPTHDATKAGRKLLEQMYKSFGPSPSISASQPPKAVQKVNAMSDRPDPEVVSAMENGSETARDSNVGSATTRWSRRRRVLADFVPDAPNMGPIRLMARITARLQSSPEDPKICNGAGEIMDVVKVYLRQPGHMAYPVAAKLYKQITKSFGHLIPIDFDLWGRPKTPNGATLTTRAPLSEPISTSRAAGRVSEEQERRLLHDDVLSNVRTRDEEWNATGAGWTQDPERQETQEIPVPASKTMYAAFHI